ncbi:MAG TPA: hypothetical protein VFO39_17575 [Candidatus Sulfotelmatobacter sp.]|nr:hypothetical protein [Candidatus Sulfotelmatobacter sp.]
MKALLIPEARMMFVSLGADGRPSYRLETLDDWIARVKARGHVMLEEKQLKFHIERYATSRTYGAATRGTATASKSRAASTAFKRSKKQADGELRASSCRPSRPGAPFASSEPFDHSGLHLFQWSYLRQCLSLLKGTFVVAMSRPLPFQGS